MYIFVHISALQVRFYLCLMHSIMQWFSQGYPMCIIVHSDQSSQYCSHIRNYSLTRIYGK